MQTLKDFVILRRAGMWSETMKYLLDTNILSECAKSRPNASVMRMLERNKQDAVTASPVWHELEFGSRRLPHSRKREILETFLYDIVRAHMVILPYDARAGTWHAVERQRLSALGRTPSFVDGQIAAISAMNNLVLVTRNVNDFQLFAGIEIENWYES